MARATSIPIASGERLVTKYEFRPLLEKQAAAILQPALGRVGGILEAKIATCSPNFLIQESIETFGGFHAELVKQPIRWQDGYIIPPTAPGLGVELDERVAAAHPYDGPVFPEMVEEPL